MKESSTQQRNFVEEALLSLFHYTPDQFLQLLSRDGNIFLRFYWDQVAKNLNLSVKTVPFGLNYELRPLGGSQIAALISLPKPVMDREAYYVALIYRPERITPFLRISDQTKMVVLEHRDPPDGSATTLMVEWSKRKNREVLRKGLEVDLEIFFKAVLDLL